MAAIDFSRIPGTILVDLCTMASQKAAEEKQRKETK